MLDDHAPLAVLSALVLLLQAHPAAAARGWDLIYTDRVNVTLCSNGCGITLAGMDFALLVNTGDTNLDHEDVFGATFEVRSSTEEIVLIPFVNDPNWPVIPPILPGEAVGGVMGPNEVLQSLIQPGETHRNTSPAQFLAFQIARVNGSTYEGPASFDVKMRLADRLARFTVEADVKLGEHAISFPSAARAFRVTAEPMSTTPVRPSTWGSIKRLYR